MTIDSHHYHHRSTQEQPTVSRLQLSQCWATSTMSSSEKCQRFQPSCFGQKPPVLANIPSLPFSLNILPVFETFPFLCSTSLFSTSLPFFSGFSVIFTLLAYEHELVIVLGVRYFHWLGSQNAAKWHLRGTYLTIFPGEYAPRILQRLTTSALVGAAMLP